MMITKFTGEESALWELKHSKQPITDVIYTLIAHEAHRRNQCNPPRKIVLDAFLEVSCFKAWVLECENVLLPRRITAKKTVYPPKFIQHRAEFCGVNIHPFYVGDHPHEYYRPELLGCSVLMFVDGKNFYGL